MTEPRDSTTPATPTTPPTAVLWDFGGVFSSSPFDAFAQYEQAHGLPDGFLRQVNATDPDRNAWARLERAEVSAAQFDRLFADESAALGHRVPGADVIRLLFGEIRPEMLAAVRHCKAHGLRVACITNNLGDLGPDAVSPERARAWTEVVAEFEQVFESSKLGMRKPEPRIYTHACAALGVAPPDCIYLDDLGINLKPAKALGMRTIKVVSAAQALAELETMVGFALRP
ncbi:MAG: HAD-IA family hydrolase [Burkholderiales bacterium]|jgi:putative hydrolase of the HAD superfamily|nr:HAD-IA family hydrolase [Burkholderiales bacterium]